MSLSITKAEDWAKLMAIADMPYVVDFTATWCGPCKAIGPFFDELSLRPEYSRLAFLKVDVDKLPEVAAEANVNSMPTFQVWNNGKSIHQTVGASKDKLVALLNTALGDPVGQKVHVKS